MCGATLTLMLMIMTLTRTSHTRHSNIKRIRLQRKVLQRLRVMRGLRPIALGQVNHLLVAIGIVLDPTLPDSRHMVQPVQQIRGPEGIRLGAGDGVALCTHGEQRAALEVAELADDGFVGAVLAAPVAAPACLITLACVNGLKRVMGAYLPKHSSHQGCHTGRGPSPCHRL